MYGYTFHTDGTKTPKDVLSYSGIDLWRKNKDAYRKRYYEGEPSFTSAYTVFGSDVHKQVEEGTLVINGLDPKEYVHEVHVQATIDGVKVQGYIDMLHRDTKAVTDLKTSVKPWTPALVQALDQLPMYSLLLREHHNKVSLWTQVVWLETAWTEVGTGIAVQSELALTGRQEILRRRLYLYDMERVRDIITNTAKDIAEDFTLWQRNTPESTS